MNSPQTVTHQWVTANVSVTGRNAIRRGFAWTIRLGWVWHRVWRKDRNWYVIEPVEPATNALMNAIVEMPVRK